jgi:hypothetical protein
MAAPDRPDDLTALIAATLVRAHAAAKATPEQLAGRIPDFLPTAVLVRDALAAEGWLNDGEEQVTARRVLNMEHIRKALRNEVAMMAAAERETWIAQGRAMEHMEMLNERKPND